MQGKQHQQKTLQWNVSRMLRWEEKLGVVDGLDSDQQQHKRQKALRLL